MALNTITAKFCPGSAQTWTDEAYQWDYGQVLQFDGLTLPDAYEVHFSNTPMSGETITQIGGANGVSVPDQFFLSGSAVYAWIYLHEGEDDGETVYMVTIPVKKRPQPSDDVPTPVEQSAIDQAIAALNIAVTKTETAADKAEEAITHYPAIIDGTWHVWDVVEEEWVDTGVQAQGEPGQPGQPGQPGAPGQPGEPGVSPQVSVQDITGGHRVTITDATGTTTFDVMDGEPGQPGTPGTPGTPGQPGYSPTVTVSEITGGHRVTITDAQGSHVFDVMDGSDASVTVDDELSNASENPVQNKVITGAIKTKADLTDLAPSYDATATYAVGDYVTYSGDIYRCTTAITTAEAWAAAHWTQVAIGAELTRYNEDITELSGSIAPVETSTTATAAHAVGELFMMGEILLVALSAIAVGDTITTEGGSPNAAVTTLSSKLLKDVQVNGTSVVSQCVAEIPLMDAYSKFGIPKVAAGRGLSISASQKTLYVDFATTEQIKVGTVANMALQAAKQHESTFYGLAKAAGSDEKNSSLAVGTYTDAAKMAIQKMLGIYEAPWELIREDTFTNATEADVTISVDNNGEPFEITDAMLRIYIPKQDSQVVIGSYGSVNFNSGNSIKMVAYLNAITVPVQTQKIAFIKLKQEKDLVEIEYIQYSNINTSPAWASHTSSSFGASGMPYRKDNFVFDNIVIKSVTGEIQVELLGKRKWS